MKERGLLLASTSTKAKPAVKIIKARENRSESISDDLQLFIYSSNIFL